MPVQPIPDGFHSVTPYLIVDGASNAIDFYKRAFGATERMRLEMPGDRLAHAEVLIGDSVVMLADEFPDMGAKGPHAYGGSPAHLMIYVADVDARVQQAVEAGAEIVRPVNDQFYGDRSGTIKDPFGHQWTISTHVDDVSPEECARRFEEMCKGGAPQ